MNILNSLVEHLHYLSDKRDVGKQYENAFSKKINWKHPTSYNEKIQIFKISKEAENLWPYVDKYEVRTFVEKQIGAQYLIPLYGIFEKVEDIQIKDLPDKFVLKATHGSAWNIRCLDKSQLDWEDAKKQLSSWLKINFYTTLRERQYKKIKPRIICEQLLEPKHDVLLEYKLTCFSGKPHIVVLIKDRFGDKRINQYDTNWNVLPLKGDSPHTDKPVPKPDNFEEILEVGTKLCAPFKQVRVDLYSVDGKIYFGELTFSSNNGSVPFDPPEYDEKFGELFKL